MTPNEHPILKYFKLHKEKTVAGNKEHYEVFEYTPEGIVNYGGDTMTNQEEFRSIVSKEHALSRLQEYFLDKCDTFNIPKPTNLTEWEEFLHENWYI